MTELKKHQQPMCIEDQVENLKSLGLIIRDEKYAKKILNDISYFRVIKAFSLGFKDKNSNYNPNVTFEQIIDLYKFNAKFRQQLFNLIEIIEVNLRCRIANYFSIQYGVLGYKNRDNFVNKSYHEQFLKEIEDEINRNSKAPFVRNFRENYESGDLPLYALVEVFSFGTLSKFYKNMQNKDKKAVAKSFNIGYTYFESWIESIAYVRNICAHYGRLYNSKLSKTPTLYKEYSDAGIGNNRIFGVLLCMKNIFREDEHWDRFVNKLKKLIKENKSLDIKMMGFPENWIDLLKNKKDV